MDMHDVLVQRLPVGDLMSGPVDEGWDGGPEELIRRSGLFSPAHYAAQAAGTAGAGPGGIRHYLDAGEGAGLSPNPLFDPAWYAARHGARAPLLDYLAQADRRDPHPLFATAFYLAQDPALGGLSPLAHYLDHGWREGLDPHPLFSSRGYLEGNHDVAGLGYNPLVHFLTNGWREGRQPCAEFDVAFYLDRHPDVARSGVNPLLHYVSTGAREGRAPSAGFDPDWYGAQCRAAGLPADHNPLVHFRTVGRHAGWLPMPARWTLDDDGLLGRVEAEAWMRNAALQAGRTAAGSRPVVTLTAGARPAEMPSEGLVLVLREGDVPRPGALELAAGASGLLVTFDAVAGAPDGRVLPVLLPGANPLFLLGTAEVPPFCADAALLREVPWPEDEAALPVWFRGLVAQAEACGGLRHLPVPLVTVPFARVRPADPAALPDLRRVVDAAGSPSAVQVEGEVSVVICTKDAGHLLTQLVTGMVEPPLPGLREVVVVVNQPGNGFARAYHERLRAMPLVRVIEYDRPYNFSDQANLGARACAGAFVLLLNDDIVPIGRHWLSHLLAPFARASVAVAGPLLLYPDETVQHAGMFMGFNNVAGHRLRGARLPVAGTAAGLAVQSCAAVTGAVMMVRRSAWEGLAGFDTLLATFLQDVDLCLRVRRMGWEIAFTPDAVLLHMESISAMPTLRDPAMMDRRGREHARFARRWRDEVYQDPFHGAHWSRDDEAMRTLVALGPAAMQEARRG